MGIASGGVLLVTSSSKIDCDSIAGGNGVCLFGMKLGGCDIGIVYGVLRVTSAAISHFAFKPGVASAESGTGLDVHRITSPHALKRRLSLGCGMSDPDSDPFAGSITID